MIGKIVAWTIVCALVTAIIGIPALTWFGTILRWTGSGIEFLGKLVPSFDLFGWR